MGMKQKYLEIKRRKSFRGSYGGINFEVSEFVNPLDKLSRHYAQLGGSNNGLSLVKEALTFSERAKCQGGISELERAREKFRRKFTISQIEIRDLQELADLVGEESYGAQYALMELVQAAAVAHCDLSQRNVISHRLAFAAKNFGKFDRARQAYADVVEGLQIMTDFFKVDRGAFLPLERALRRGWDEIKEQSEVQQELFDPATADPTKEWFNLLIWNSDIESDRGLLDQIDAVMRLAIRWRYWKDSKGKPLQPLVRQMLDRCEELTADEDSRIMAFRFMVTIGDALIEISEWDLASLVYAHLQKRIKAYAGHPLQLHAVIQGAYCDLMVGNIDKCRARLQATTLYNMEKLGKIVITVAAEQARYITIDTMCRHRNKQQHAMDAKKQADCLLERVSLIASSCCKTRTEYLRSLFYSALARDLEFIWGSYGMH